MPAPKDDEFCPLHATFADQIKDHETRLRTVEHQQERNSMKLGIIAAGATGFVMIVVNVLIQMMHLGGG